jgi:hypothetical protein
MVAECLVCKIFLLVRVFWIVRLARFLASLPNEKFGALLVEVQEYAHHLQVYQDVWLLQVHVMLGLVGVLIYR